MFLFPLYDMVVHKMLSCLNFVPVLYFVEECYIVHIHHSTEVWRIFCSACDHHSATGTLQDERMFEPGDTSSEIVWHIWVIYAQMSVNVVGFPMNSLSSKQPHSKNLQGLIL
jgi:hypothetical protein